VVDFDGLNRPAPGGGQAPAAAAVRLQVGPQPAGSATVLPGQGARSQPRSGRSSPGNPGWRATDTQRHHLPVEEGHSNRTQRRHIVIFEHRQITAGSNDSVDRVVIGVPGGGSSMPFFGYDESTVSPAR